MTVGYDFLGLLILFAGNSFVDCTGEGEKAAYDYAKGSGEGKNTSTPLWCLVLAFGAHTTR